MRLSSISDGVSDLKLSKFGVITLLLFGMIIGLIGIAGADPGVAAVPETQSLTTVTDMDVMGLATETDEGVWTLTNDPRTGYYIIPPEHIMLAIHAADLNQLIAAGGSFKGIIYIPASLLNVPMAFDPTKTWADYVSYLVGLGATASFNGGGIHDGALHPGQVQYTTAYDANIVAQAGHTSFVKSMNIDTRNKVIGQSNIKADTALTFIATADGGNVVGSENIMLDGAGDTIRCIR